MIPGDSVTINIDHDFACLTDLKHPEKSENHNIVPAYYEQGSYESLDDMVSTILLAMGYSAKWRKHLMREELGRLGLPHQFL